MNLTELYYETISWKCFSNIIKTLEQILIFKKTYKIMI